MFYFQLSIRVTNYIRNYFQAIEEWTTSYDDTNIKSYPNVTTHLRKLTMSAASTHLDRFENTLTRAGKSGLVGDMNILRDNGFNAFDMVPLLRRPGDNNQLVTGADYILYLCQGSPKLRFILEQISSYILPKEVDGRYNKLLLTEDIPLTAFFFELVLNLTYVETAVLHSALTDEERVNLIKRFNNEDDPLRILIIMYSVSAAGANLDPACCRVIVVTPAINSAIESQAYSRVIRVCTTSNKCSPSIWYKGNCLDIYRFRRRRMSIYSDC